MRYLQVADYFKYLKFPNKYVGTRPLTTRSSWESSFISKYLDINQNIISWTSESVIVKYISPLDGKSHRYFIDFSFKCKDKDGNEKEVWVEIKPFSQTNPPKEPKRRNQSYVNAVQTYLVNQAKWNTSRQICENYKQQGKNVEFLVITEKDCGWFIK
jgi:hypothetical protein